MQSTGKTNTVIAYSLLLFLLLPMAGAGQMDGSETLSENPSQVSDMESTDVQAKAQMQAFQGASGEMIKQLVGNIAGSLQQQPTFSFGAGQSQDSTEQTIKEETETKVLSELERRMQEPVCIDVHEEEIQNVLRMIAEQADIDIITSPTVTGPVTAKLTDVPLEEALTNILTAHGYGYVATNNMIRVAPAAELQAATERLVNRVYRIIYADVKEVEKALEKFISARGSISSSPSTSNIIVTDTESRIKAIDMFIDEIDRVTPQVLVEVRIYDVTTTDDFELGVAWNVGTNRSDNAGSATDADRTNSDWGALNDNDDMNAATSTRRRSSTPFAAGSFDSENGMGIRFGFMDDAIDIDIMLNILSKQIGAKLLANPRIMVLDNEDAAFRIVREIPYTEVSNTSGGGLIETTKFKEVGVELNVTPHVTRDEMLRLHLQPTFGVVVGTIPDNAPPTVDTRTVDTIALVKDQQTVVIGGLRKRETSQNVTKIPVFGDMPLVGGLFRDKTEEVVTNELLIFITPRIIIEPELTPLEQATLVQTNIPDLQESFTRFEKKEQQRLEEEDTEQ